ncbi:MAG TPA: hypothetical protein VJH03_13160 [Blastocatellia bacterium]|nr:hypothetical protein [Blastocatellia bacterium]
MKKRILISILFLLGAGGSAFAGGDFDRLKALVGEWESTSSEGTFRIRFQLVSNGTALMETMKTGSVDMITVYHPDGESTLMTHYCAVGNQPRMRAQKSSDAKMMTFQIVDVANLKGKDDGHMLRLVIRFQDADHLTEEWTWVDKGKEATTAFHLRRVK